MQNIMNLLPFLILFPLGVAIVLLVLPRKIQGFFVLVASILIAISSLFLFTIPSYAAQYLTIESHAVSKLMFFAGIAIAAYIVFVGLRARQYLVAALAVIQAGFMAWFELGYGTHIESYNQLFIDKFSLIMAFIVGVFGSLICVYAVSYMKSFHETYHPDYKDNRTQFFFMIFVFFSAMFGIIFSNNLMWFAFFWEVTTICSFVLIGYRGDEQSKKNAFHALLLNLIGGIAITGAIVSSYFSSGSIELSAMILMGKGVYMLPVMLIAFAGIVKSAQMPFSSWLLGAMVAPTPISALLHSTTMVKAGVYAALRMAPLLQNTFVGMCVIMIGGITFLITSFIAVSQSDAKKVLAYSTVANLGLVILCAGIGTYEAVWAGILLIIFHAVAKCLLFLTIGVVEHKIGSRNIEDMEGLIVRTPKLAVMLLIGMAGMFLAPFGMLISKWAVMKAVLDAHPIFVGLILFGSSATLFFWVKWMGKILMVLGNTKNVEYDISVQKWIPLYSLSFLTIITCLVFPLISVYFIEPYILDVYGNLIGMKEGNIIIMLSMLGLLTLFPLSFIFYGKKVRYVDPYLGGANANTTTAFSGTLGQIHEMKMSNYHLEGMFGEKKLFRIGLWLSIWFIILMCGASVL